MKTLLIFHSFILAAFCISAQEVLSSAGETQKISGYEIGWTIGEPVTETISSGSTILTQGFQQSKLTVTASDELLSFDLELKVYPNPTSEFVIIQSDKLLKNSIYSLFDLSGKLLECKPISDIETIVDLNFCATGTYLLCLQNDKQPMRTFKIVKSEYLK